MIKISSTKGKRLALFGLGGSGLAAAKACMAGGADVTVWDDREEAVRRARELGLKAQDLHDLDWKKISSLILSPGVPLTHPEPHWSAALARQHKVEIIGDIELFLRERKLFLETHKLDRRHIPFVAITGTNGKSTATALIAHMLNKAGWDAQTGGNIGRPILELEEFKADNNQAYIIECSSYQIELTPSLAPTVGILLNITPDHIDRHGSFDEYAAVKARLAEKSETAIVAYDDAPTLAIYQKLEKERRSNAYYAKDQGSPRLIGVGAPRSESGAIPQDCVTTPPEFAYRVGHFYKGDKLLMSSAALRGRHNGQNGICALAACAALGAEGFEIGLKDFRGLPHRMEEVGNLKYKGVTIRFINDSKATNAEAAAPALLSYRNIYWLAGGQAKAGGINMLLNQKYLAQIRRAYFFGEAASDFAKSWANAHSSTAGKVKAPIAEQCPYEAMDTMAEAIKAADRAVKADIDAGKIAKGSEAAILLAPACASFDQFKSFEHRGREFTEQAAGYCATALLNEGQKR